MKLYEIGYALKGAFVRPIHWIIGHRAESSSRPLSFDGAPEPHIVICGCGAAHVEFVFSERHVAEHWQEIKGSWLWRRTGRQRVAAGTEGW